MFSGISSICHWVCITMHALKCSWIKYTAFIITVPKATPSQRLCCVLLCFLFITALNCLYRNAPFVIHLSAEMLQFAFCIAHCHRSVTSGASGDHQPLFSSNLTSNPCLYSFQMGMGTVKVQHFIIVFLPIAFLQTLIIPTNSPFLFYFAPTRNPLCPCRRIAPGSKEGWYISNQSALPDQSEQLPPLWSSIVSPPTTATSLPIGKSLEKVATVQNLAGGIRTHGNHSHSGHW